jgi:hypothetical protein
MRELYENGGSMIWQRVRNKLKETFPFFSKAFSAVAHFLGLNENSRDGWMAPRELYRISAADGIVLAHCGLTHVGQVFGRCRLTGCIAYTEDMEHPEPLYAFIVTKCKNLRHNLRG